MLGEGDSPRATWEVHMYATMADAHREWHRNAGVPMGTPGCPQDACHLPDEDYTHIAAGVPFTSFREAAAYARIVAVREGRTVRVGVLH